MLHELFQTSKAASLSAVERRQSATELSVLLVPMRSFFLKKAVAYMQKRVRPEVAAVSLYVAFAVVLDSFFVCRTTGW